MPRFLVLGFNDAQPGSEAEYNDWHRNVHLPEVCAVPGVLSARRFAICPTSPTQPDARSLVIYEVEADDPTQVLAEFGRRSGTIWSPTPPSADRSRTKIMVYEQQD